MPITTLKDFQTRAIDSAVAVFDFARKMLDAAGHDAQGRKTAIHENGYLLIESPTGSGKTLMRMRCGARPKKKTGCVDWTHK